MPRVEFEPTVPVFEWANTFCEATAKGLLTFYTMQTYVRVLGTKWLYICVSSFNCGKSVIHLILELCYSSFTCFFFSGENWWVKSYCKYWKCCVFCSYLISNFMVSTSINYLHCIQVSLYFFARFSIRNCSSGTLGVWQFIWSFSCT
jgi:hypothetical protein